jgi:hypothetical protein
MDRMVFMVQGSEIEPYRVTLEKADGNLNAYCTCAAGSNGQSCKHRFRILSGNPEGLIDSDLGDLGLAVDWVIGTDVETALRGLIAAEDNFEAAKKELAKAKKMLAQALLK